jgi:hypothetical protein
MPSRTRAAAAAVAFATAVLAIPGVAFADDGAPTGRQTMQFECGELGTVTIVTPPASAHDNWSAAPIVGGGHLIPVAFTYLVHDDTVGITLSDETVAHPAAHTQQSTTTCTTSQTAILGDVMPTGATLPEGVALDDTVTMSFIVTAIAKP